ncbi:MAG: WD40 repeat domain-containing protein, partial [Isosphaeraceae bacterium]
MVLLQLGLKVAAAQGVGPAPQPALPVSEEEPIFRLEAGGPSSLVTGLAFAPDGQTLYVAGWDKIVRVWALDRAKGEFQLDRPATFRVPIGPGLDGAINSLAVSSDAKGEWLAVAGQGLMRGMAAGFRKPGLFMPLTLIPEEMKLDQGQIEVFNTRSNPRRLRPLRGHRGGVLALAIAPIELGQPVVLASAAKEGEQCVVRVWDVESGQPLATLPGLPLPTSNGDRPRLVVRRRGAGPREIDVAIAWGDGLLRLWDLAAEPAHATERQDGSFNVLIDWFGPNGLVTASYERGARAGQLRSWSKQANGGLGVGTLVQFPAANDGRVDVPRAMALFGAPPGGAPQQAAILLARLPLVQPGGPPASQIEYLLQLHSLDPALSGQVRARFTLGAVPASKPPMPVLAVAPTGEHLAVAFRPDHEVMIFSIKELLAGKSDPIQTLRSPGLTVRQAALVRKGEDWGLLLRREPKARLGDPPRTPSPGDYIVDLKTRGISAQTNGWAIPPDPAGHEWQIGHDNRSVALWRNGNLEGQVQLQPEDQLTDFALSPPGPGSVRTLPVLAVALLDRFGAPSLKLYDGATGQQVRELSGHTDTIRGLSFSGDGRWLVSASEDQTVSVWDLADLESSLEQLKRLQGVHLAPGDRGLVVQKATEGNPLREGDRITGIIRDGKGVLLEAPGALAQSIFSNHPGEELSLWRERPNAQPEWVRIKLERAIAERKPLVSLFFAPQAAAGQPPRWLAWTPLGSYDLSDPALENFLGWHFNIEQTDAPTRFAEAAKYRGLQRSGLLRDLIMGP